MIYTSKNFYDSFQLNYFDYKQSSIEFLLQKNASELEQIAKGILDYNEQDYRRALKMDCRLTYLLALDTLFELIFALLPNKKLELMDDKILDQLARKNQYFPELKKSKFRKPNQFDKLKYTITYNKGKNCSVLRYLFYDGLFDTDFEEDIKESVDALMVAINFFTNEAIEHREELNSFKHGLRITPYFGSLTISYPITIANTIEFDMKDSITFQTKQHGVRTIHAKAVDYKRDCALTLYISNMLYNIIVLRRRKFRVGDKPNKMSVMAFKTDSLDKAKKSYVKMGNFKLNLNE